MEKNTKVICTIGPKIANKESLSKLIDAGMNVIRFNMVHSSFEYCKKVLEIIKELDKEKDTYTGILLDLPGPKIRINEIKNKRVFLEENNEIKIVKKDIIGNEKEISINYKELDEDINQGAIILLNDGKVKLKVKKINYNEIICDILTSGYIETKKGVNVPGVYLNLPFLSKEDIDIIKFSDKIDADFLGLSFVSSMEDVLDVNDILINLNNDHIGLISKIENVSALSNIDDIIKSSDGIMIARGDLGVEVEIEKLPIIQKELILKANENDIFSIVATQLLASMENNETPTRAEISDVANAILDGADAIMLSGESAVGKYPIKATETMSKIAKSVEKDMDFSNFVEKFDRKKEDDITKLIAHNVVDIANRLNVKYIVSSTSSGYTAKNISKFRPCCPIIATSQHKKTVRSLVLNWGIKPVLVKEAETSEEIINKALNIVKKEYDVSKNDIIIITGGSPSNGVKTTNFMKIEEI